MSAVSIGTARWTGRQLQQGWPQLTGGLDPPAHQLGVPPAPQLGVPPVPNEAEEPGASSSQKASWHPRTVPPLFD